MKISKVFKHMFQLILKAQKVVNKKHNFILLFFILTNTNKKD